MLKQRIITAVFLLVAAIAAIIYLPSIGFLLVAAAIFGLAAHEWSFFTSARSQPKRIAALLTLIGTLLLSMIPIPLQALWSHHQVTPLVQVYLLIAVLWWFVAGGMVLRYPRWASWWSNSQVLKTLFGVLTLVPFFWALLVLREWPQTLGGVAGAYWLLFVMVLVWMADSGAYFAGRRFGKHKLSPKVSPGKTWEGAVGGVVAALAAAWLMTQLMGLEAKLLPAVLMSTVLAVISSVLGDLAESMFKRRAGIKDSGSLLPGHGGVLDRIDSLTAAVPVFTFSMLWWLT